MHRLYGHIMNVVRMLYQEEGEDMHYVPDVKYICLSENSKLMDIL